MLPTAEGGRQLISTGTAYRVAQIGFYRRYGPLLNAEALRQFVENSGLRHPILGGSGAMGLHETRVKTVLADQVASRRERLGHGDVVPHPGRRNRFLVSVRIDEDIADRTINLRTQLDCQFIIAENYQLCRLGETGGRRDGDRARRLRAGRPAPGVRGHWQGHPWRRSRPSPRV